tara:strand:+ start:5179 stop:5382 length:204 start_codon:yes stop_codon:yes gene_type:complete
MKNLKSLKIKEGQRITFKCQYDGKVYTKKVKDVVTRAFNDLVSYNVNPIGSGTMCYSVEHEDVISVK